MSTLLTQDQRVLLYIEEHKGITSADATYQLGVLDLQSSIYRLRKKGYPIADRWEAKPGREGKIVRFKKYYMEVTQ